MEYTKEAIDIHSVLMKKYNGDVDKVDSAVTKLSNMKFEPVDGEDPKATMFDLNLYSSKYSQAVKDKQEHELEVATREDYLVENPDEELSELQEKYKAAVDAHKNRADDSEYMDTYKPLVEAKQAVRAREIHLKKQTNAGKSFGLFGDVAESLAVGAVNSVLGVTDFITAGQFPEIEQAMKTLAAPDLELNDDYTVKEMSYDKKQLLSGAQLLGALATPAAEMNIGKTLALKAAQASKLENFGLRVAIAAKQGASNYGSALAMTIGDDNAQSNAGFAGGLAGTLGYGGKVGFVVASGLAGGLVGEHTDLDSTAGVATGVALAGAALLTKGAITKLNPGVTTLVKDAKKIFNISDAELIEVQQNASKLFNVEDVSTLTDEQLLVSIFNSNPNAKAMMYKATVTNESYKSAINQANQKISGSLANIVEKGAFDDAAQVFNQAQDDLVLMKHNLEDVVDSSGLRVKVPKVNEFIDDFDYAWPLSKDEKAMLAVFDETGEVQASEMLQARDIISKHMDIKASNTLEKKIAMKAEEVLAQIDNQVLRTFSTEEQAMYFANNRTQAQIRTLKLKGEGLANFLNERLPTNVRYKALQNVMESEHQYANLLKLFEGEPAMMQSFEDVVLARMFEKSTKEGVLDFVKLSGEIERLPWNDIVLKNPTQSISAGEQVASRGQAIRDIVKLYKENYANVRFNSGLADDLERIGTRTSPTEMAKASVLTRVYHKLAQLWSSESRIISKLPEYLKNQQIPANVSIEENSVIFDMLRMTGEDIRPVKMFMSTESQAGSDKGLKYVDGSESNELNFIANEWFSPQIRTSRKGPVQDVTLASTTTYKEAQGTGWKLAHKVDKQGEDYVEAAFMIKDEAVNYKIPYQQLEANKEAVYLDEVLDTEIFNAFPELADLELNVVKEAGSSYMDLANNRLQISTADLQDMDFIYATIAESAGMPIETARAVYKIPATLEGRFRLVLNHEMQHVVTVRSFPKITRYNSSMVKDRDTHPQERLSEVARIMQGEDIETMNIQSAFDSQDAMRGGQGALSYPQ